MEELKAKAKKLGLWNMFLPKNHFKQGAGYSNVEYGLMAELLGKSKVASEVGLDRSVMSQESPRRHRGANVCFVVVTGYEQCCPRYW